MVEQTTYPIINLGYSRGGQFRMISPNEDLEEAGRVAMSRLAKALNSAENMGPSGDTSGKLVGIDLNF